MQARREQGLVNLPEPSNTKSIWEIIRDNVFTLFNALNLAIGVCLSLVGAWVNMTFLLVVFLNCAIGIVQQIYAKRLVEKLSLLCASSAQVIRDGEAQTIAVEDLVLDDLCLLTMGGQICADAQVMHGQIEVNESLLTGEVDPIKKAPGDMVLSGSFVVSGKCYAKTVHVGADNFVQQLSKGAKRHRHIHSHLIRAMGRVTKLTGYFIPLVGIVLFIQAYFFRRDPMFDSVVSTSAALLGMLPKGLVLLISVSLAAGVIALSRKKVLVQDLHCIETLAYVDTLCLDKTGTITQGHMGVRDVVWAQPPQGVAGGEEALQNYLLACEDSNATIQALKASFEPRGTWRATSQTAFSSQRKWGGVYFESKGMYLLGAPEVLLRQDGALPDEMAAAVRAGDRVLCFAFSPDLHPDRPAQATCPLAYIRISDPVREEAAATFRYFADQGVMIKVISGDNPLTVCAVAKKAGLEDHDKMLDCSTLKKDEDLFEMAEQYAVFGRVTPNQKLILIKALQAKGRTVAMTGDGVNDVLALRQADCSIAIGSGSDAARQVAQLVLLDSNFDALPHILKEGRRVVNNITRVGRLFFIKTLYSALLSLLSIMTCTAFPFVPIQITLMDGLLEGFPSFFLSFEPDYRRIRSDFLPDVVGRALPFAGMIFVYHLLLVWGFPAFGITEFNDGTVLYYLTGFAYLLALFRSCVPFNALRRWLFAGAAIGFYACVILFADFLYLEPLSMINAGLFGCLMGGSLIGLYGVNWLRRSR